MHASKPLSFVCFSVGNACFPYTCYSTNNAWACRFVVWKVAVGRSGSADRESLILLPSSMRSFKTSARNLRFTKTSFPPCGRVSAFCGSIRTGPQYMYLCKRHPVYAVRYVELSARHAPLDTDTELTKARKVDTFWVLRFFGNVATCMVTRVGFTGLGRFLVM